MADDERLLASLVLLLRLSPDAPAGEEIAKTAARGAGYRNDDAPSPLQDAWEGKEGELVCFAGRLVRHCASCAEGGTASAAGGVYLRLAARAAFLRYAPHFHEMNVQRDDKAAPSSERIRIYERGLLASLLSALHARASEAMEEVDVEMAWVAQHLAVRLSSGIGSGAKNGGGEGKSSHSNVWTKTIDAMVARRCKKEGGATSPTATLKEGATNAANDEQLMVQTLNAILDGNAPPDASADGGGKREDWAMQYDASLITYLQTFLQLHLQARESENGGEEEPLPLWTQRALFGVMRWSQQNQTLSLEACRMTLQYLRLCSIRFGSEIRGQRGLGPYYSSCVARGDGAENNPLDGAQEFAAAVRSLVFHGLAVLANAAADASQAMAEANTSKNALPTPSSTELRGDIYSLVLELWHGCGPEWLMINAIAASVNEWWWFPSGGKKNEHRLGATWPLCTLVRLAAGEFRLGLGQFMAFLEREETSTDGKGAGLISEIDACAGIVAEATRLMTSIAEDEDSLSAWSPDAILHIRTSLEDALNSSGQYFNSLPEESKQRGCGSDEIGRSCCLVMGTIAAELEVDHLLAPPSVDASPSADKERGSSLFPPALGSAIRFCDSIGTRGDVIGTMPYERQDPLAYLLPCIMSLVSNAASQQGEGKASEGMELALASLQQGNCLVLALSGFLRRTASKLRESAQGDIPAIQSVVQLCALIVDEYTQIAPEAEVKELRRCLALCEKHLAEMA